MNLNKYYFNVWINIILLCPLKLIWHPKVFTIKSSISYVLYLNFRKYSTKQDFSILHNIYCIKKIRGNLNIFKTFPISERIWCNGIVYDVLFETISFSLMELFYFLSFQSYLYFLPFGQVTYTLPTYTAYLIYQKSNIKDI